MSCTSVFGRGFTSRNLMLLVTTSTGFLSFSVSSKSIFSAIAHVVETGTDTTT